MTTATPDKATDKGQALVEEKAGDLVPHAPSLPASPPPPPAPPSRPVIRAGGRQVRYMSQSILLEEGGNPRLVRMLILVITTVLSAFIAWAATARIEEMAISFGQVIPSGRVQPVQHLEGGIAAAILVADGDHVEAGQLVVQLDPTSALAELDQMRARLVALSLQNERLRAYVAGRAPAYPEVESRFAWLVDDQKAFHEVQERSRSNQMAVIDNQIDQRRSEVAILEEHESTLNRQAELFDEERSMRKTLFDKGLSSKIALLNILRESLHIRGELARAQGQRRQALSALAEVNNRRLELDTRLREDAMNQLATASSEFAQVTEAIRKLEDRVGRVQITAPVAGIVKGLTVTSPGTVIAPGKTILEVVPVDDAMQLETKISTRDIGHVHAGQPANVKFVAYDFARYGVMTGTLASISATTFLDPDGQPHYRGIIALDRPYLGDDPNQQRILPGMTAQAEVRTGEKTLLEYLLRPIYRAMQQGFRER